ncbi:MAG: hypothetical protein WA890_21065 [Micromonospora sp.]
MSDSGPRTPRPASAALFEYDLDAPLHLDAGRTVKNGDATITDISYDDSTGRRVPAYVVSGPESDGRGIVVAHGGTADGRHFFVDEALSLARLGFTVLLPATTLPAHGDVAVVEPALRATVLTHRRALDVLTRCWGVDAERLGYFGHSGGASQGAVLSAVEPRLAALVLASIGSGTILRLARADLERAGAPDPEPYLAWLERFDPAHFVAVEGPRRLFFQHGADDQVITRAEAERLYDAAAPPRQWREYACDHGTAAYPPALRDRAEFFSTL